MNLYHQNIIDHYRNPRNKGELKDCDFILDENNPLCGDKVIFYIKLNKNKTKIKNIKFDGEGCAISQSVASMLTEILTNKDIKFIKFLDLNFVQKLLGIEINPGRIKCALLAVQTLKKLIDYLEHT